MMRRPSVEIICPLYKAEKFVLNLHKSLLAQTNVNLVNIHYVLTESKDDSEKILKRLGVKYDRIKKNEFSHSLVREKTGLESKADIIVFITQDVDIRRKDWLEKLIQPIANGEAEAAYSRQLSRYDNIEKYTREGNYPEKSFMRDKSNLETDGLKTFFFSDASGAIKQRVFKDLKAYDGKNLPINEDMYFAYKLIMKGGRVAYVAESEVYHSHNFKLKELYDRYKMIGQFMKMNSYLEDYGVNSSGFALAKYILRRILQDKNWNLLARYPFDMSARLLGMKIGRHR